MCVVCVPDDVGAGLEALQQSDLLGRQLLRRSILHTQSTQERRLGQSHYYYIRNPLAFRAACVECGECQKTGEKDTGERDSAPG